MVTAVKTRLTDRPGLIISALLIAALMGAFAADTLAQRGSPPPPEGTIQGCVSVFSGNLRILAEDATCSSNEYPIEWNQQGIQGEQGPAGPVGPAGPTGPSGLSGYETVSDVFNVPTGGGTLMQVACPAGKQVLGGGYNTDSFLIASTQQGLEAKISQPSTDGRDPGWTVAMTNTTGESKTVTVYAICATVAS